MAKLFPTIAIRVAGEYSGEVAFRKVYEGTLDGNSVKGRDPWQELSPITHGLFVVC